MKEFYRQAVIYRMAILIATLFCLDALVTACITALTNIDWHNLSGTEKFVLCCCVVKNVATALLAFLNKTLSRVEAGKTLIETGETQFIAKTT